MMITAFGPITLLTFFNWSVYNHINERLNELEDDIPNIRVLMTVVGGKAVHLVPSLANEIKAEPVGPITWKRKPLAKFFP